MFKMTLLFLSAAIPLYAVGLSLYAASNRQIEKEILETRRTQMVYYMDSMENELTRLTMLEAMILKGKEIGTIANRYYYFTDYERSRRVNALRDQLTNLSMSGAYTQSVTLYLQPLGMKLNSLSGLDDLTEADIDSMTFFAQNTGSVRMKDGILYAVVTEKGSAALPYYTLATQLSASQITSEIRQLSGSVPSYSLILYEDQTIVAATDKTARTLWESAVFPLESAQPYEILRINGEDFAVIRVSSSFSRLSLITCVKKSDLLPETSTYAPYLLALTAAALVLLFILIQGTRKLVYQPLIKLNSAFAQIRSGNLAAEIYHPADDEFRTLYENFNTMAKKLDQYVNQSLRQELMLRRSELMQLQAQINPHFLYNSYFMLHRMIKRRDWENAERFSGYMGEYFRYITRNAEQKVPIETEAGHARIYAEIQQMRFGDRIHVEFGDIPESLRSMKIPRLILQPLIENAFVHGMKDTDSGGLIRVCFEATENGLRIIVEDNGCSLSDEHLAALKLSMDTVEGETTALRNICHRIRLTASDEDAFELKRSSLGGLRIEVCVSGAADRT